jgi:hypothetical protein
VLQLLCEVVTLSLLFREVVMQQLLQALQRVVLEQQALKMQEQRT